MARLRLVNAPPLLPLRVVDRNAPLSALDEHDECDHDNREHRHGKQRDDVDIALSRGFE
jgi:hypothetical protein